jgi:hypothetical protein
LSAGSCGDPTSGIHNTNYCKVDATGKILTPDQIFSYQQNSGVHSGGGGCIARPIRDVWGVFFNNGVMKPDDVDEYTSTPKPELVPANANPPVLFVFDLYNVHHVPLINPAWTVRWYHSMQYGTFETPNEVAINFQKIQGTSYIRVLQGGFVLDRVTDDITSWVMDQYADAERYDTNKAYQDVQEDFTRMRTGPSALPAAPMVNPSP